SRGGTRPAVAMASQVRRYFAMVLLEIREWSENSRMLHFAALPLALPFSPWSTHRAIRRATYGFDRLYTVPAVWASLCQSDNELKPLPRITPPIERAVINHLVQINPHLFLIENRKSTRLNSSHVKISYAVFCLKKKKAKTGMPTTGQPQ